MPTQSRHRVSPPMVELVPKSTRGALLEVRHERSSERSTHHTAGGALTLTLVPVSFKDASDFIGGWHRHNRPPIGHKFSIGVSDAERRLVGVAMIGRPVARSYDDGLTLEVIRTATDGTKNANSMLYGAAWRASKALGYGRLITYTQATENGSSLRAAGWQVIAERKSRHGWDAPSRPRDNSSYLASARTLWEATLAPTKENP